MFFARKRRAEATAEPVADPMAPSDDQVGWQMARLADAFVRGAAEEGHHFTYDLECVSRLDPLVDLFLQGRPSPEVVDSMAMSMGAFVGELILRFGGGRWVYVAEAGSPAVQTGSRYTCFPLNKVGKRLIVGPEHSIARFVDAAMAGDIPPEARQVR